jgi:hypothetical protein
MKAEHGPEKRQAVDAQGCDGRTNAPGLRVPCRLHPIVDRMAETQDPARGWGRQRILDSRMERTRSGLAKAGQAWDSYALTVRWALAATLAHDNSSAAKARSTGPEDTVIPGDKGYNPQPLPLPRAQPHRAFLREAQANRRVTARYEKLTTSHPAILKLVCNCLWLQTYQSMPLDLVLIK